VLLDDLAERPVGGLAVGEATACALERLGLLSGQPLPELAHEPRLAHAGLADDRDQPRRGLDTPRLLDLWKLSDDGLRALLKGSAMKRAGVKRLRRNLAVAIGNSGDPAAAGALADCVEPTAQDPLVAEHVAWAIEKLRA